MSFATARAQIVSLVTDVVPTDDRLYGQGCRFVHDPEGRSGRVAPSRTFWLEANTDGDGGVTGPYTPDLAGQPRLSFALTLTVFYKGHAQRAVMDEVLAADQIAVSKALLTPGNWNRPTSGILSITNAPFFLPTRRVVVDGNVEQRMALALWFN